MLYSSIYLPSLSSLLLLLTFFVSLTCPFAFFLCTLIVLEFATFFPIHLPDPRPSALTLPFLSFFFINLFYFLTLLFACRLMHFESTTESTLQRGDSRMNHKDTEP
jgi:hypothetical protein